MFFLCSCFGQISSLNGEPEKGIAIEVGIYVLRNNRCCIQVYLCLSVSMSVRLLLMCFGSIYRLSASIAANLFKKKQFLIKRVNIACVDFRFVKKISVTLGS